MRFIQKFFPYITLFCLLFITYFDLIKHINSLTFGNDLALNWNYANYLKKSFWEFGQFPLWFTGFLNGFPMNVSNPAAIFYPPHLIFLFLPLKLSFNLLTLTHVYLTGIFSYLLAKEGLKLSKYASLIAAIAIMLSPRLINHNYSGHLNPVEATPWMILSIFLFIKAVEKKSLYLSICSGLALALIITVFSIFYIYTLFALGIFLIFHFSKRALTLVAILVASSFAFSSIFLIPFVDFSAQSLRGKMTFWDGAFPAIYRDSLKELFEIIPQRFHDSETLLYIGVPTLLLAIIGIITYFKKNKILFLLTLGVFALTVSFGANEIFYKIYYRVIPVFHFLRAPVRIWILFVISMGLLAGFGTQYLLNKFPKRQLLLTTSFILIIFASLWVYNKNYFIFVNYETPDEKILNSIPSDEGRLYCLNNCLLSPFSINKGYQFSNGGEAVVLKDYYEFMRLAGGYSFDSYSLSVPPYQVFDIKGIYFEKQTPNPKLLGITNTKFVISPYELTNKDLKLFSKTSKYYLYENLSVLPKAFSVPNAKAYSKDEELLDGNFKKEVYLKGSGNIQNPGEFKEETIKLYSPNKISLEVTLENKGFLVLSELYYPGWKAFVDGQEVPILKANGIVRSITLEPGKHKVEFKYFPDSLKLGIIITFISLTLFIIFSLWRWRY